MIIKLNAIDSTNAFMKQLIKEKILNDYTTVVAQKQTEGRGQMGTSWQSEPYKNLIMSVFKYISCLKSEDQFFISMAVSMAVLKTLETFKIKDLMIKWPNDILSANKKICGILIEAIIKQGLMDSVIIGVGLNVNQMVFPGLDQATSMQQKACKEFDIDMVRDELILQLKNFAAMLNTKKERSQLKEEYLKYLFRLQKPSTFENAEGTQFMGFIQGVHSNGKLIVKLEDNIIKQYNVKEIKLLY